MAAYTSQKSGNWNDSTAWKDGSNNPGVPGSGDTATIASPHTITVPDTYTATVGTATGTTGTGGLAVSSGGHLVIGGGASGQLRLQGDLSLAGTTTPFVMAAGSSLVFVPAPGQRIKVNFSSGNPCNGSINGTAAARCSIFTDPSSLAAGGLTGYFTVAVTGNQGLSTVNYADFSDLNDGVTTGSGKGASWTYNSFTTGSAINVNNNTFTRCGAFYLTARTATAPASGFTITNNQFINSVGTLVNPLAGTYCLYIDTQGIDRSVSTSNLSGNVFDIAVGLPTFGWTINDNQFHNNYSVTGQNNQRWVSFARNLVTFTNGGAGGQTITGNLQDVYTYHGNFSQYNPHFWSLTNQAGIGDTAVTGGIWEFRGNDGNGDGLVFNNGENPTGIYNFTIRNNIVLPNNAGINSCCLMTLEQKGNYTFEHNTACVGGQWLVNFENYANTAGYPDIVSFKGNLCWSNVAGSGLAISNTAGAAAAGIPSANVDSNAMYNLATGTNGPGYGVGTGAGPYGPHDVSTNPNFVDPGRCLPRFSGDYLGDNPSRGAWADATGYAAGDTVSTAVTNWIGGATILYRCTSAHTSAPRRPISGNPAASCTRRSGSRGRRPAARSSRCLCRTTRGPPGRSPSTRRPPRSRRTSAACSRPATRSPPRGGRSRAPTSCSTSRSRAWIRATSRSFITARP